MRVTPCCAPRSVSRPPAQVSVFFRTSPKHKLKIIKVSWEPRGSVRASPGRWQGLCSGWSRAQAGGSLGGPQTGLEHRGDLGHVHQKQEPERGGAERKEKQLVSVSRAIFGLILVSYLQASVSPLAATWFQGKAVDPSLLVEREPDTGRRSVALTEEGRLSPLCRWRS